MNFLINSINVYEPIATKSIEFVPKYIFFIFKYNMKI